MIEERFLSKKEQDELCLVTSTHPKIITIRDRAATKPKERGHGVADDTEDALKEIANQRYLLVENVATRAMGDIILELYPRNPVNGKASCIRMPAKNTGKASTGQPNVVSMKRLCKAYLGGIIDGYWIWHVDYSLNDIQVVMFDILENLHLMVWNAGPGQMMLTQGREWQSKIIYTNTLRRNKIETLRQMVEKGYDDHISARTKDRTDMQSLFENALKQTL